MKLIDLLVQELPKRGGWPLGNGRITCSEHNGKVFAHGRLLFITSEKITSRGDAIDRDEYEAALAASQQPAWSGEGLPPVGIECEWLASGDHDWMRVKVLAYHEDEVWLQPLNGAQSFTVGNPDDFRTMRTEAELRREETIAVLKQLYPQLVGNLAGYLYNDIAAGKIPGVKLGAADE